MSSVEMLAAFSAAWNRHDLPALMSFMHADCVFETAAGPLACGTRHEGHAAVAAAFESAPAAPHIPSGPPPSLATAAPATGVSTSGSPAGPPPPGATMRCKDGTYLTGTPSPTSCDGHQGVAALIPVRTPPSAPARIHQP